MSHGGHGGKVDIVRIGEDSAMLQQTRKSGVILGAKPQQIIVPKLVDHKRDHELGLFVDSEAGCQQEQQDKDRAEAAKLLHCGCILPSESRRKLSHARERAVIQERWFYMTLTMRRFGYETRPQGKPRAPFHSTAGFWLCLPSAPRRSAPRIRGRRCPGR